MLVPSEPSHDRIKCIVDHIVKIRRQKTQVDLQHDITDEERQEVIIDALGTYQLLSEKSINQNGKILVEYRKGVSKILEEVMLFEH